MADDRVTIGGALGFAWTLWTRNWRAMWPALALNSLALSVACAGQLAHNNALYAGGGLANILTEIVVYGAVLRLALGARHGDEPAYRRNPSGVHWNALEWRMLGAKLLLWLFFTIVIALLLVALGALVVGVASSRGVALTQSTTPEALQAALGPVIGYLLMAALAAAIVAVAYLTARLGLALPATVDRNRVSVLSTWKLTSGRGFLIMATVVALGLPIIFSAAMLASVAITASGGSESFIPAGGALSAAVVMGLALGAGLAPMTAAVLAYFYLGSRDRA